MCSHYWCAWLCKGLTWWSQFSTLLIFLFHDHLSFDSYLSYAFFEDSKAFQDFLPFIFHQSFRFNAEYLFLAGFRIIFNETSNPCARYCLFGLWLASRTQLLLQVELWGHHLRIVIQLAQLLFLESLRVLRKWLCQCICLPQ